MDSLQKAKVTYTPFIFSAKKKDAAMAKFNKELSEEERYTILAINRLDSKNKWRADTLAVPDKMDKTLMSYTPFPIQVEKLKEVKKIVIFSYPIQAYSLYENGKLIKWGPTSMGKKSAQTHRGLMFANWKKELAISTVDSDWKLPYNVNVHNTLGIGWHQYDLPGFPASHSCLRLLMDDAKYLYNWVDTWIVNKDGRTLKANGTPVIVYGDYDWGGKKPWKKLIDDPHSNDISMEELDKVIEPYLHKILEAQKKREQVLGEGINIQN
ncbi:L,D-transpeptidase [Chryseobacterium koreense]|uniref:L,D-transpeptidase n=1 Tax=Chryseobacterium koreense TaxID=232216 RepID=UPI0026F107F3|nr:L,D-transpeptidase [Chryseobacterium koreense]